MKKLIFFTGIVVLAACGGRLSDEQRKKMHEQMELHKIRRVTEAEITEAAFARGREIMTVLESFQNDSSKLDSMIAAQKGKLRWVVPGDSNAVGMEQQLINAYLAADTGGQLDNVQKIRNKEGDSDSILYTRPVLSKLPNGSDKLEGIWSIWLSQKQLILSMDNK